MEIPVQAERSAAESKSRSHSGGPSQAVAASVGPGAVEAGDGPFPSDGLSGHGGPSAAGVGFLGGDGAAAELHRKLERAAAQCYPASARRFRQAGEAGLRFCLRDGAVVDQKIVQGSGFPLLDRAATECVLPRAAPLPPSLTGCFEVPVKFSLRPAAVD